MYQDKYGDIWQSEELYKEYLKIVEIEKPNLKKANEEYKKYRLKKNEK